MIPHYLLKIYLKARDQKRKYLSTKFNRRLIIARKIRQDR